MENNKNKKSVKFQGDMLYFCDFIQVYVFSTNHHLKGGHLGVYFNEKGEKNRKGQVASPDTVPIHLKGLGVHTDILSHSKAIFLASVKIIQ